MKPKAQGIGRKGEGREKGGWEGKRQVKIYLILRGMRRRMLGEERGGIIIRG